LHLDRRIVVALAIFDLDNTLIAGDSDVLWGHYLAEQGHVDATLQRREHQRFYDDYLAGTLDIQAFLSFQLRVLREHDVTTLEAWREAYLREKILPIILPKALDLLQEHRSAGRTLMIITATNSFLTAPIATMLGVEHLIATIPELSNGRYTGAVVGQPSYREGKVQRLTDWLSERGETLRDSWFYSDSLNDIPLLAEVTYPVAVDPDPTLRSEAQRRNWPIVSLR
jgi:HAD superfamily hydrolase (TIGR01490 family)